MHNGEFRASHKTPIVDTVQAQFNTQSYVRVQTLDYPFEVKAGEKMIVADCSNEPLTGVLWPWPPYTLDLVRSSDERAASQYSFQIHNDKFKNTQCEEKTYLV